MKPKKRGMNRFANRSLRGVKSGLLMLMLAFMFLPMAFAEDANPGLILVGFSICDGQWLAPRAEFFQPGLDLEANQDKDGRLLTVRIDLNGDSVPEYFIRTLCGNGGCEYPISVATLADVQQGLFAAA